MTSTPHLLSTADDPSGWRLQWELALQQPALDVFFGRAIGTSEVTLTDNDEYRRAAYWAAVVLGNCRLRDIDLGKLDGSLPTPLALAACERLQKRVGEYSEDAKRLDTTIEKRVGVPESTEPCFSLLEGRMEVWAAFVAIDESYYVCVEDKASEQATFARAIDDLLQGTDRLDRMLQERIGLLTPVADFPLLENWRRQLASPYDDPLPWWLDGRIEAEARRLEVDAANWLPRPRAEQAKLSGTQAHRNGEPRIDFQAKPDHVRLVAEGQRLGHAYQVNPTYGTETALIHPLPHQRIAVYQHLLPQTRLRFLLADDAGAGKTIMAGLYIREMLTRRLVRRVLIVPPAGLVGNWRSELSTLFNLGFRIISGADAKPGQPNPFAGEEGDRVIVSLDTLAREPLFTRLREQGVEPYDLVVFDEAHKLAADRGTDMSVRRTGRYRLAEALAGAGEPDESEEDELRWSLPWSCHHLLLLSATPHMGKDYPYYALWRLLEPEVLSTQEAFRHYPGQARRRHFLRRTKEEMVDLQGRAVFPTRVSDTLSYDLSQGADSEQELYDRTTAYIREMYNRAALLNRSAARLAMSVFQRRLASSTLALARSLERRLTFLKSLAEDLRTGRLTPQGLRRQQRELDRDVRDPLEDKSAGEEEQFEGREENEVAQDSALRAHTADDLKEVEGEIDVVGELLGLAARVQHRGDEAKFVKLQEALEDQRFSQEKVLIFTEHRDTLDYLVRRLEALGFTGQVAQIHGGMDYTERDEQVAFFRKQKEEGGAQYMVATDAAGEGINLQFCWIMINYDIPWNPARIEQRMGRIHRYGQRHDPVFLINLVAGKTREGAVLETLLKKLETIRKELKDKVFDVIGRLLEGVSLRDYMERVLTGKSDEVLFELNQTVSRENAAQLSAREKQVYGDPDSVRSRWGEQEEAYQREQWRRQLPGFVRRFIQRAAPELGLRIEGDLEDTFRMLPAVSVSAGGAAGVGGYTRSIAGSRGYIHSRAGDRALPFGRTGGSLPPGMEGLCGRPLTLSRPSYANGRVFLHPGERFFDLLREQVCEQLSTEARRGGTFLDPHADHPYLFHLARVSVLRRADRNLPPLAREELLDRWLVGVRQMEGGPVEECPMDQLLLLRPADGLPLWARGLAGKAGASKGEARDFLAQRVVAPRVAKRRQGLLDTLEERSAFLWRSFGYQEAELSTLRARLRERMEKDEPGARSRWETVKARQRSLETRRDDALAVLRREPELLTGGEVEFLAHALVLPGAGADELRRNVEVEEAAVRLVVEHERRLGAEVQDVSRPQSARAAGLADHPGFDLLSVLPGGERRAIEIKGRWQVGEVELTANEWAQACNHRDRYWLYVVFGSGGPAPQLVRVQDPFGKLLARRGSVMLGPNDLLAAAEHG